MKTAILALLAAALACAQVPQISNTTTIKDTRTSINTALVYLDTNKSASNHNHSGIYAALSHVHLISDITGLQTNLDGKEAALGNPDVDGKVLSSTAAGTRSWIEAGSGSGARVYSGLCRATNNAWPVQFLGGEGTEAPIEAPCDATHQTSTLTIPNNTSTYQFYVVQQVEKTATSLAIVVAGYSADTTHATTITPSYACVTTGSPDNPSFTALSAITLTSGAGRTTASAPRSITCTGTATAPARLFVKFVSDTTALTGGATFAWTDFSLEAK